MRLLLFALLLLALSVTDALAQYRILAYGDSNTWGWKPDGSGTRYPDDLRWSGILQSELGEDYTVVTDGMVARRTDLDGLDAGLVRGDQLNAAKTLPAAIARHAPLDLVIVFLGTNDLQLGAERSAEEVAYAVTALAELISKSERLLYADYAAPPETWVVVPPSFGDLADSPLKGLFAVGKSESERLTEAFAAMSERTGLKIFDLDLIKPNSSGADGIHLTAEAHRALGQAIAEAF